MSPAMRKATFSLAILAVFGVVIAYLSIYHPPVKEFVGTIAGGIVSVAALVYAASSRDEAKEGRAAGERAELEARDGRAAAERGEREARLGHETAVAAEHEARAGREAGERAARDAAIPDRDKRRAQRVEKRAQRIADKQGRPR